MLVLPLHYKMHVRDADIGRVGRLPGLVGVAVPEQISIAIAGAVGIKVDLAVFDVYPSKLYPAGKKGLP